MGNLLNKWFENNQRDPEIRHEFPLYDVTDNLYQHRDHEAPAFDLPNNVKQANNETKKNTELNHKKK